MKKIIGVLLCFVLLLACVPVSALAADGCGCGVAPVILVVGLGGTVMDGDTAVFPPQLFICSRIHAIRPGSCSFALNVYIGFPPVSPFGCPDGTP